MKTLIVPLAGMLALTASGAALAANTCAPTKHKVVHRIASYHSGATTTRHVKVLAEQPKPQTYTAADTSRTTEFDRDREVRHEVRYVREYIYDAPPPPPPPPPVIYERYPLYPAPLVVRYGGPRYGYGWGYRGFRRWR